MKLTDAYAGEDLPIEVTYRDENGAVDPDDTDADGTPDATITITDRSDGTELVSAAAMTHVATGEFEYVWDTDTDGAGASVYEVEVTADFDGATNIERGYIRLE